MAEQRKKAGPAKGVMETRPFVEYLPAGVAPDLTPGTPSLDPELEKARDREAEALAEVKIDRTPVEPTIDPALVKIRDEQIKRERERATVAAPTATTTTTDEAPAKKPTAKKSAKK